MKKGKGGTQKKMKEPSETPVENIAGNQSTGAGAEGESIDRIRNILFGAQTKQFEQQFTSMENLMKKEVANLRNETKKNFESLENYIKKEIDTLAGQLQAEQDERSDLLEDMTEKFTGKNKMLEKKISQLTEKVSTNQRETQGQILEQSKNLMDEIRENYEKISAALEESVRVLQNDKTDRTALANLLTEMAMRLKNEFEIPGID